MQIDAIAGQAAALRHQQTQAANRAQENREHDDAVGEARSARAEEAARSDEPSRARQTAPRESADADRPEREPPKDGGVDIRV